MEVVYGIAKKNMSGSLEFKCFIDNFVFKSFQQEPYFKPSYPNFLPQCSYDYYFSFSEFLNFKYHVILCQGNASFYKNTKKIRTTRDLHFPFVLQNKLRASTFPKQIWILCTLLMFFLNHHLFRPVKTGFKPVCKLLLLLLSSLLTAVKSQDQQAFLSLPATEESGKNNELF